MRGAARDGIEQMRLINALCRFVDLAESTV
jgi:hypothetical protein